MKKEANIYVYTGVERASGGSMGRSGSGNAREKDGKGREEEGGRGKTRERERESPPLRHTHGGMAWCCLVLGALVNNLCATREDMYLCLVKN